MSENLNFHNRSITQKPFSTIKKPVLMHIFVWIFFLKNEEPKNVFTGDEDLFPNQIETHNLS